MVLLPAKQASDPSPKLIIVATYTHGINGGTEIAMLCLVADPGPLDGPAGCLRDPVKMARFGVCLGVVNVDGLPKQ